MILTPETGSLEVRACGTIRATLFEIVSPLTRFTLGTTDVAAGHLRMLRGGSGLGRGHSPP